jgi:CubicO group peptidase (beta-lactamase class C family)
MGIARRRSVIALAGGVASLTLTFCGGDGSERVGVPDYAPLVLDDGWTASSPEEHGLDPARIGSCYQSAAALENIHSLLVVRDGELVSEAYFNGAGASAATPTASVTKSITSALVGIALHEGLLTSLDQPMADFFPEIEWRAQDPRKSAVTLRQILQMRSGYPWEEQAGYLDALFSRSDWIPLLAEFPLTTEPGTQFGYSNLTAHVMGIVVARAADRSLYDFARSRLFDPLGIQVPSWPKDARGCYYGSGDAALTPRSMAKLGQLYLDEGLWNGAAILPAGWVEESWRPYSIDVYDGDIMSSVRGLGYGYLWWSARSGSHHVDFAWGHGGQVVFVVRELRLVVVATAEYLGLQFGSEAWRKERGVLEVVGSCIASL